MFKVNNKDTRMTPWCLSKVTWSYIDGIISTLQVGLTSSAKVQFCDYNPC